MGRERYEPSPVPFNIGAIPEYLQRELRRIASMLKRELEPVVYISHCLDDGSVVLPSDMVTGTNLPFTEVEIDTKKLFDAGTDGVEMSAGAQGFYVIVGYVQWSESSLGDRQLYLTRNGGVLAAVKQRAAALGNSTQEVVLLANVYDGNSIELQAFQDSGGSLTVASASLMLARMYEITE